MRVGTLAEPLPHLRPWLVPSLADTANRCRTRQVLLLNRTMLSDHESPYVGRFACDWHRLATTDPRSPSRQSLGTPRPPRTRTSPTRPKGCSHREAATSRKSLTLALMSEENPRKDSS